MESEEEVLRGPVFVPPVYQQRYEAVIKVAKINGAKKILDAGCSEGKLITQLKIHCPGAEEIVGVDIDKEVLTSNSFRIRPLMAEYLFKRDTKLRMALCHGSILEPDLAFEGFDLITCVEVVEHLEEECLELLPAALFGIFRPNIVIMTTPNADFNVLFPNFTGFRHPDHKFEWTREEFRSWCFTCSQLYGYSVEFSFIGFGPEGTEALGGCSQMAVFMKLPNFSMDESLIANMKTGPYAMISDVSFPYQPQRSIEEKLGSELKYLITKYFSLPKETTNDDSVIRTVPLEEIMKYHNINSLCQDIDMLRKTAGELFPLSEDGKNIVVCYEEDEDYFSDDVEVDYETNQVSNTGIVSLSTPEEIWD